MEQKQIQILICNNHMCLHNNNRECSLQTIQLGIISDKNTSCSSFFPYQEKYTQKAIENRDTKNDR